MSSLRLHDVFVNSSGSLLEPDCPKHPFELLACVETRDQAGDLAARLHPVAVLVFLRGLRPLSATDARSVIVKE